MASSPSDNGLLPSLLASTPNTSAFEGTKAPRPDPLTAGTPLLKDAEKKNDSTPSHIETAMASSPTSMPTNAHDDKNSPPSVSNDRKSNSTTPNHVSSATSIASKTAAPTPTSVTHSLPASTPIPQIHPAGHNFREGKGIDPQAAHDRNSSVTTSARNNHTALIAGIATAVCILLLAAVLVIPWFRQKLRRRGDSLGLGDKNGKSDKQFFEELENENNQANRGETKWYGVDLGPPCMVAVPKAPSHVYAGVNQPASPPFWPEPHNEWYSFPLPADTYHTAGSPRPSAPQAHEGATLEPMTNTVAPIANRGDCKDVKESSFGQGETSRSLSAHRENVPPALSFENLHNPSHSTSDRELRDKSSQETLMLGHPSPMESIPFIRNVPRSEGAVKSGREKGFGFMPLGPRVSSVYPHESWARAFSCENLKESRIAPPLDRSASTSALPIRPPRKQDSHADDLP